MLVNCLVASQLHLGLEAARVIVILNISCRVWLYFGNHEAVVEWKQLSVSNRINLRTQGLALVGLLFCFEVRYLRALSTLPEHQTETYVNCLWRWKNHLYAYPPSALHRTAMFIGAVTLAPHISSPNY
jgi:hypothetical protein